MNACILWGGRLAFPPVASALSDLRAACVLLCCAAAIFVALGLRRPLWMAWSTMRLAWDHEEPVRAALNMCAGSRRRTALLIGGLLCMYTGLGLGLKAWQGFVECISQAFS
jgi:hypothetical protein